MDDAFIKLFFESSNDEGALCPHLEDFECSSETEFSETTILQFVKERNGDTSGATGLTKLKHLYVLFYGRPGDIDLKQELEPYEHAGLVATITYPLSTGTLFKFSAFDGLLVRSLSGFGGGLPGLPFD